MTPCKVNADALIEYFHSKNNNEKINFFPFEATDVKISYLTKIHGGKHDAYSFSLTFYHDKKEFILNLILKFYAEKKIACREYLTLDALKHTNFPVPTVYILETNETLFGVPFIIMERIEGQNMKDYIHGLTQKDTFAFFERFAELLVALHELNIELLHLDFLEIPKDELDYAHEQALSKEINLLNYARNNNLAWAITWLEQNAIKCPCHHYSLLHGDMNPKNFLITPTGKIFFIDWTWSEIGDALKDVGYAYHNIRQMFGLKNVERQGDLFAEHFLNHYERKSNLDFNDVAIKYYLFSAGLREAMFMKMQSKFLLNPISTLRVFGLKFFPAFLFISWHFRKRYKDLLNFIQNIAK